VQTVGIKVTWLSAGGFGSSSEAVAKNPVQWPLAQGLPCSLPSGGVTPGQPETRGAADHGWLWWHFPLPGNTSQSS